VNYKIPKFAPRCLYLGRIHLLKNEIYEKTCKRRVSFVNIKLVFFLHIKCWRDTKILIGLSWVPNYTSTTGIFRICAEVWQLNIYFILYKFYTWEAITRAILSIYPLYFHFINTARMLAANKNCYTLHFYSCKAN